MNFVIAKLSSNIDRYEIYHRLEELRILQLRIERLEEDELVPRGIKVFDEDMDLHFEDDRKFLSKWKDIYWRSIGPENNRELGVITKKEIAEMMHRVNSIYERWDNIYGKQLYEFKLAKLAKKRKKHRK